MTHRKKSLLGRLVVLVPFWAVAAYATVAVLGSILSSLYGRPPAHGTAEATYLAKHRAWCLSSVAGLRDDLSAAVTHELTRPGAASTNERWREFTTGWLAEVDQAEHTCASSAELHLDDAFARLRVMHATYDTGVEAVHRARGELQPALDSALAELSRGK